MANKLTFKKDDVIFRTTPGKSRVSAVHELSDPCVHISPVETFLEAFAENGGRQNLPAAKNRNDRKKNDPTKKTILRETLKTVLQERLD